MIHPLIYLKKSDNGFLPVLSSHRRQFYYSCGRESPIWAVHSGAKECEERPRTTALAGHRPYHPEFQGERPIQSVVTSAARTTKASEHINNLATPKRRQEGPFREAQWPVSINVRLVSYLLVMVGDGLASPKKEMERPFLEAQR